MSRPYQDTHFMTVIQLMRHGKTKTIRLCAAEEFLKRGHLADYPDATPQDVLDEVDDPETGLLLDDLVLEAAGVEHTVFCEDARRVTG